MENKQLVIIDVNWWVSASINRQSRLLLFNTLKSNKYIYIYSDELLSEYRAVICREKFARIISAEQIEEFIEFVTSLMQKRSIETNIIGSRDEKDNYLLALAYDSRANYLVTGDKDLLVLIH